MLISFRAQGTQPPTCQAFHCLLLLQCRERMLFPSPALDRNNVISIHLPSKPWQIKEADLEEAADSGWNV